MRLINTTTVRLEEFSEANCPPYAILSHTWANEEVTFQEMQLERPPLGRAGYEKILQTCHQALAHQLDYAWIDTCCIDKSSSTELSEAINSMFRWYAKAKICFAYLADIHNKDSDVNIVKSRWFTRGWTLQELIAPRVLLFYSSDWRAIGSRDAFRDQISESTRIGANVLRDMIPNIHHELSLSSIAQRMSWAAGRQTTRKEDLAYCLLGIFGINMPLLYGEGERAFLRLQEKIIRHTDDHSIFAWRLNSLFTWRNSPMWSDFNGVLATTPNESAESRDVVSIETGEDSTPFLHTYRGIQINLRVFHRGTGSLVFGILHYRIGHAGSLIAIPLTAHAGRIFGRHLGPPWELVMQEEWKRLPSQSVYLATTSVRPEKYQIPFDNILVKPLPKNVSWGGVSKGYRYDHAAHLIEPEKHESSSRGIADQTVEITFHKRLKRSKATESLSISVTFHPLNGHIWRGRKHTLTYNVKHTNASSRYKCFATVKANKVFGQ